MTPPDDDILDDLFHGCAWAAFVELAVRCKRIPDIEETRRLAYDLYEEALAQKHRRTTVDLNRRPNRKS